MKNRTWCLAWLVLALLAGNAQATRISRGQEKSDDVLYHNGVCVKPDWNKAVHFYVLANDAGQKVAAYRLAAGFAAPEHGADVAAALWWASRPQVGVESSNCGVPADARDDPDRFVAALKTWSPQHLAACNHLVGVMSTLGAEIRYPDKATSYQLGGVVSGDTLRDRASRSVHGALYDELSAVAGRALKRYPQPKGIDPDSSSQMRFTFRIVD